MVERGRKEHQILSQNGKCSQEIQKYRSTHDTRRGYSREKQN